MEQRLSTNSCDLAPSGFVPTVDRLEQGLHFSAATNRAGLGIMVISDEQTTNPWYFLTPMSALVWVVFLASALVIGVIIWTLEYLSTAKVPENTLHSEIWTRLGTPLPLGESFRKSFSPNIVIVVWAFLCVVIVILYSANLTANLTVSELKGQIRSVNDLKGLAVGSWYGYQRIIEDEYALPIVPYPWNDREDEQRMVDDLKAGGISAIMLDSSTLYAMQTRNCDTTVIYVDSLEKGFTTAFPQSSWDNRQFIEAFNAAIYKLIDGGVFVQLVSNFSAVLDDQRSCPHAWDDGSTSQAQVTWGEVSGLWIVLGSSIGLAAICILLSRMWRHYIPKWQTQSWYVKLTRMTEILKVNSDRVSKPDSVALTNGNH